MPSCAPAGLRPCTSCATSTGQATSVNQLTSQAGPRPAPLPFQSHLQESPSALDHFHTRYPPLTAHDDNNKLPPRSTLFYQHISTSSILTLNTFHQRTVIFPPLARVYERIDHCPRLYPPSPTSTTPSPFGWVSLSRRLRRPVHDGRRSNAPYANSPAALGARAAAVTHAAARMEVSNVSRSGAGT